MVPSATLLSTSFRFPFTLASRSKAFSTLRAVNDSPARFAALRRFTRAEAALLEKLASWRAAGWSDMCGTADLAAETHRVAGCKRTEVDWPNETYIIIILYGAKTFWPK